RELAVPSKGVPELYLLCPPRVPGLHQVQVRHPSLPRCVRLDEEAPPRPTIQLRRHLTPAIRNELPSRLPGHHGLVTHRGHQVDDRLGGEPGNRSRPDMLASAGQPRRQQLCQPFALCPCPVSPPRVIRTDFSPLIRPCGSSIAHCATVTRLCDSQSLVQPSR